MQIYHKEELSNHYKKIYEQNKEKLLQGGTGDAYLITPETDTRMSIALVIRIDRQVSNEIKKYLEEVRRTEPNLYFYPEEDMHITVLDILRGAPDRKIPENIQEYIRCVEECAKEIRAFHIDFEGVTASDNALLVCGYYEPELEKLRKLIRCSLVNENLLFEERYKTFSAHITVARIPQKLDRPAEFAKLDQGQRKFGTSEITSLELVYHNWYDSVKTTLAKFELSPEF